MEVSISFNYYITYHTDLLNNGFVNGLNLLVDGKKYFFYESFKASDEKLEHYSNALFEFEIDPRQYESLGKVDFEYIDESGEKQKSFYNEILQDNFGTANATGNVSMNR